MISSLFFLFVEHFFDINRDKILNIFILLTFKHLFKELGFIQTF